MPAEIKLINGQNMMKKCRTTLYASDITALKSYEKFTALLPKLTERRREKMRAYAHRNDALRSMAAELLLFHALEANGINPDGVSVCETEDGKPYLEGVRDFYFNLSHSGNLAVCAVSSLPVGCDVQELTGVKLDIARRFTPEEYGKIAALTGDEAREMLFRFWTAKESYIKAVGTGFKTPLNSFAVDLESGKVHGGESYRVREFDVGDNYKCAVCTSAPDLYEAELIRVEL